MSGIAWKIYQNSLFQIPSQIKNDCIFAFIRIMYCLNNIDPIFLVLYRKTSKLLQPEHWILEHWTIQNLFRRLINKSKDLQMFNIQIEKDIFSNMLKAWIFQDIFKHAAANIKNQLFIFVVNCITV